MVAKALQPNILASNSTNDVSLEQTKDFSQGIHHIKFEVNENKVEGG